MTTTVPLAPASERPRRRGRWLIAALVLSPVLAEAAVRAFDLGPRSRVVVEGGHQSLVRPAENPVLGFEPRPNVTRRVLVQPPGASAGVWVEEHTDANGFRGRDAVSREPGAAFRIACVGDSHTFGFGVADEATWPARLERHLGERLPGRTFEVINAGVNGYDTVQEALWLERGVLPFEPDLVLLAFFANDATLADDELDADIRGDRWLAWSHPARGGWIGALRKSSRAADAVLETVYRRRRLAQFGARLRRQIAPDTEGWLRASGALENMASGLAERGIGFGVVLFPLLVPDADSTHGRLASSDPFAVVRAFLGERGIPFLDPEFALEDRDPALLRVSEGDLHAGSWVYDRVAQAVAHWLEAHRSAWDLGPP